MPEPAARLGAVVPVHWRLWPAVVQGLERRRPTVQWVLWAGRQQAAPRGWVFFFFFLFFSFPLIYLPHSWQAPVCGFGFVGPF